MKTINIGNGKGGVGKSTTAVILGLYLAEQNKRVLLCDFDGQEDLSNLMGKTDDSTKEYDNSSMLFNDDFEPSKLPVYPVENWSCRNKNLSEYLFYCPAHLRAMAKVNNSGSQTIITNLSKNLQMIKDQFDFIIFDTPPTLGVVQMACLGAANSTILPCIADFDTCGENKISQYIRVVKTVKSKINNDLNDPVVVLCNVDAKGAEVGRYIKWAKTFFGKNLVQPSIEHSAAMDNARVQRKAPWFKPKSGNDRAKGASVRRVMENIYKRVK